MAKQGRLQGKVALVTGAASGIGAASAALFAREGASVAGIDVNAPVGDGWAAVEAAAPRSWFRKGVDVRDEAAVAAAVEAAVGELGRLDVLLNAAGVGTIGSAHELDAAEWDRVLDINLKGSFLVAKHALRPMLEQRSGSIIHVASVEGLEGMSGSLAYNASKGGVVLMTKNMALDYSPHGIRVNCLCPGLIVTPLTDMLRVPEMKGVYERMLAWHAIGRFGTPEDVANCALFLASDEAAFVTGSSLVVDGGWTAGRSLPRED